MFDWFGWLFFTARRLCQVSGRYYRNSSEVGQTCNILGQNIRFTFFFKIKINNSIGLYFILFQNLASYGILAFGGTYNIKKNLIQKIGYRLIKIIGYKKTEFLKLIKSMFPNPLFTILKICKEGIFIPKVQLETKI